MGRVVRRSSAGRRHPEESAAPPAPGPRRHRLMEPGSVRSVVERLTSWCTLHERGLARVEWDSMYARQEVVNRLRFVLGESGIPVVEFDLPPGEDGYKTAVGLVDMLRSSGGSVASITGIEWAFPEGGNKLDTLVVLSFQREILAALPVRQIWWVPSSATGRFIHGVPDLDSWFTLRLHLTEVPPQPAVETPTRYVVSVAEARSIARRFWDRLEAARAQSIPEERIWAELAQPAINALRSAGLAVETDAILARVSDTPDRLERQIGAWSDAGTGRSRGALADRATSAPSEGAGRLCESAAAP